MPDAFDHLVADLKRLNGSARLGALDEVNAQKLAYSEFGTATAPMRPTLSATFDQTKGAMQRSVDRRVAAVLDGKSHASGRAIVSAVAEEEADLVREAINGDTPPALAASTLAARRRRGNGSTRSLVDTGQMLASIAVESKDDVKPWQDGE